MNLLIYRLDSSVSDTPTCILKEGEHILGRGEPLGCNDKRASRRHACIKIENGNATITSIHQNPCFFQSANSTTLIILTKDVPKELQEGDKFGIFPDDFWFKIRFQNDFNSTMDFNSVENVNTSNLDTKLKINNIEESTAGNIGTTSAVAEANSVLCKISSDEDSDSEQNKTEVEKTNLESISTRGLHNTDSNNILLNDEQETIENLPTCSPRAASNSSNESSNIENGHPVTNNVKVANSKENKSEKVDDVQPSSSRSTETVKRDPKLRRDKCWYGSNCYRQQLDHKTEFSHPDDSDYDSDPNDVRRLCRYGKNCYRKNEEHLKKYKHSGVARKPFKKRRDNKKRNSTKKLKNDSNNGDSSEDDYDFDDPFLNDDDSADAYSEESWTDSYSDDSSVSEQDVEDTTTLFKEAKRFKKRKK